MSTVYTSSEWCNMSAIDPFSERMYAKLAPHSPAPTPARVDARECGLSFEKVADINASDNMMSVVQTPYLGVLSPVELHLSAHIIARRLNCAKVMVTQKTLLETLGTYLQQVDLNH